MFLIVDNHDSMCVAHLSEILVSRHQPFIVRDRAATLDPCEALEFSGVFLSGGDTDLTVPVDMNEISLDLACLGGVRAPIFGICEGFEITVAAFGGRIVKLDTPIPTDPVPITLLTDQWFFTGLPEHVAMLEFNSNGAASVPPFLEVTAFSERSAIEAVQHRTRPIAATQFHPEATDQNGNHLPEGMKVVNNFIDYCLGVPTSWWYR